MEVVVVHDRRSARRALDRARAEGRAACLVSPPRGVARAGAAFFVALGRELGQDILVDATGCPGYALEALRLGARAVLYRGEPELRRRLDRIARELGARVHGRLPAGRR